MAFFVEYADTVQKLLRFTEVKEYFKWHIGRWCRKKSLLHANRAKAEEDLRSCVRPEEIPPDWRIRGVDVNGKMLRFPPELLQRVEKREALLDGSLLTRLTRTPLKDLTPSERFTLLAQIHDAFYKKVNRIVPTSFDEYEFENGPYISSVAVLENALPKDRELTSVEATRLNDVLAFVLARTEAKFDPATKDDNGERLMDVIGRLRQKWKLRLSQTIVTQSQIVLQDSRSKPPTPPNSSEDTPFSFEVNSEFVRIRGFGEDVTLEKTEGVQRLIAIVSVPTRRAKVMGLARIGAVQLTTDRGLIDQDGDGLTERESVNDERFELTLGADAIPAAREAIGDLIAERDAALSDCDEDKAKRLTDQINASLNWSKTELQEAAAVVRKSLDRTYDRLRKDGKGKLLAAHFDKCVIRRRESPDYVYEPHESERKIVWKVK